ncbi:unnamed protein product [Lathyrus sativus]|nr:unnamed protein product [Lathyrus sativus]
MKNPNFIVFIPLLISRNSATTLSPPRLILHLLHIFYLVLPMSGFSQASSRIKSHSNFKSNHGKCLCGLEAPLMTSWTDSNPRRCFYGCGMYKLVGQKRCGHFVWYDEEMTQEQKK